LRDNHGPILGLGRPFQALRRAKYIAALTIGLLAAKGLNYAAPEYGQLGTG
jgi:hypothetical protein